MIWSRLDSSVSSVRCKQGLLFCLFLLLLASSLKELGVDWRFRRRMVVLMISTPHLPVTGF
jgi:hypothetical protein